MAKWFLAAVVFRSRLHEAESDYRRKRDREREKRERGRKSGRRCKGGLIQTVASKRHCCDGVLLLVAFETNNKASAPHFALIVAFISARIPRLSVMDRHTYNLPTPSNPFPTCNTTIKLDAIANIVSRNIVTLRKTDPKVFSSRVSNVGPIKK